MKKNSTTNQLIPDADADPEDAGELEVGAHGHT